ncbi:MAG: ATP-dependent DNA ligase [bacterium]
MKFAELVKYFEKIEATSLRNAKTTILAELFKELDKDEIAAATYLAVGRLGPLYDSIEFNLAEKMIIRAVAWGVGRGVEEVAQLMKDKGDLGEVAEGIKKDSRFQIPDYSINSVFEELVVIARDSGKGSQQRKVERLGKLLREVGPVSAKYIVRMVAGRLRLGFLDSTVLDALSYLENGTKDGKKVLESAYQIAPDVGELSRLVKEMGIAGAIKNVKVKIGRPVIPALAQRLHTPDEMIEKMGKVQVEPKFDGTRVQIHFSRQILPSDDRQQMVAGLFKEEKSEFWVKTYTRSLDESSQMFPELASMGEQIEAQEVILDAEAVGYDPTTGKMVPFQLTITRKRKHGVEAAQSSVPLRFYVFDILYKDGQSLIELPLSKRREILEATIKAGNVLVMDEKIVTGDPRQLREYHKKQLEKGLEGALVKKIDGKYESGRKSFNWVKFKEEEGQTGKLLDTIDAVVMGYYTGKGKRQKFGIGAFLVGVVSGKKIVTVAKVGTGLSDLQFGELYDRLKKIETRSQMLEYIVAKTLIPDVWVEPKVIVEIAADEITTSKLHSSGYGLRFPRLIKFRDDKKLTDITTLAEVKQIAGTI